MRNTMTVLAALLSLSTAALADDAQPAQQPAQQAAATPDPDKKICRSMYHDGSLIRTQQCKTQREWDALRTDQQRQVTHMQAQGYQTGH